MTQKVAVTFPDVERAVIDYLTPLFTGRATVGIKLPAGWTTASTPHLVVRSDGTPTMRYPVMARPTVRITSWSSSATTAKNLAREAQGHLCAHPGDDRIKGVRALTGELPAFNPDHQAEQAAVTCRVVLRSIPI
jgi:hypothetical protein